MKKLSYMVNVDVKMSKRMLDALSLIETMCAVTGENVISEDSVRGYLRNNYGSDLAAEFRPEFMYPASSLVASATLH